MSRIYSDAYKWTLYEKYRNGFTLTELGEISGVTDKPLREWFRHIDFQYAKSTQLSAEFVQQENSNLIFAYSHLALSISSRRSSFC